MSRWGRHGAEQNRSPFPQGRRAPRVFYAQIPARNHIEVPSGQPGSQGLGGFQEASWQRVGFPPEGVGLSGPVALEPWG